MSSMALALYRSYTRNAAKARIAGNTDQAEHYAALAQHYFRAYRAEHGAKAFSPARRIGSRPRRTPA